MSWNRFAVCFLLIAAFVSPSLAQESVDIVIRGGKIVDGTGNPWFIGDVAIKGDRIVGVGRVGDVDAKLTIDASGLVVSPGFIDMHSHSDFLLLEDGNAQSKIRQGVTTEVLGEGRSAGPYQGKLSPRTARVGTGSRRWTRLKDYLALVEEKGISTNVASYVGLDTIWQCAMGTSFQRPSEDDFKLMEKLVDEAMRDGAHGLSSQVMMPPGSLTSTDDVIRLCRVVGKHGGIYSTHIRNEGLGVFSAVKEAIEIGEKAGVPVDVIHLKIADEKYWGRMPEVIELIEGARARGVNVQANVYPYTRGNNNLSSIIPPWAHEGGKKKMLERLKDKETRQRLKRDITSGIEGWYNHYTAVGGDWSRMLVSGNNSLKGLTMDRVMSIRTKNNPEADLLDELFEILIENNGSVGTVYAHHTEKDMNLALKQPWCSVGSDGSAYAISGSLRRGNPHPRNFGTFPRVLGVYVRELKLLTLEDAIRKITSLNAAKIGLRKRGQLQSGFYADVTIFDEATVIDKSAYTEPFQYPVGIKHVLVNGVHVLNNEKHTNARPGRALRQ
ncbi:MAG: dihydroorotase [Planctomycetaceae bacterium]|nr:dihydroorotase [Planctomycetaceae bacterium]